MKMAVLIQYKSGVAGIKIPIDQSALRIGRHEDNDICIEDELASREHALIERVKSEQNDGLSNYVVRDLKSTNGTFVNHEPITAHLLVEGDMIRIGQAFFKYSESATRSSKRPASSKKPSSPVFSTLPTKRR